MSTITNIDFDDDPPFFAPAPPQPSPSQGRVPSKSEALEREELLKNEYPLFKKVSETVRTLDTDEVEKIKPNRKENPDNVKRVEFILSEDNYEELFPRRHSSYTYTRFIQVFFYSINYIKMLQFYTGCRNIPLCLFLCRIRRKV